MLDSFFNLGFNRVFSWQIPLILFSFTALADFTASDSSTLASIASDVGNIHGSLDTQVGYVSTILSRVQQIHDISEDSLSELEGIYSVAGDISTDLQTLLTLLDPIPDTTSDIYDAVRDIYYFLGNLEISTVRRYSDNVTADALSSHDLRTDDIYDKLGTMQTAFQSDFAGITNSINSNFDSLLLAVNNLTNVLSGGVPAVYTNLAPMLAVQSLSMYDDEGRWLFYYLFGRYPTQSEIRGWRELYLDYGLVNLIYLQFASRFNLDVFDDTPLSDVMWGLMDDLSLDRYPFGTMGEAYSFMYGTRELTDNVNSISNLLSQFYFAYSNSLIAVSGDYPAAHGLDESIRNAVEYDPDSGEVRNSAGVVSAISDLSQDYIETLPTVSNNLVKAETNAIVNLENNDYLTAMQNIQNATPDNTPGDFDGVLSALNEEQFTSDLVSVLEESTEECVFSFDLSGFNLVPNQSRSRDIPQGLVNFTLTDVKQTTNDYVNFFCGFMECILCLFFGAMLWNLIFDSTVVFYK